MIMISQQEPSLIQKCTFSNFVTHEHAVLQRSRWPSHCTGFHSHQSPHNGKWSNDWLYLTVMAIQAICCVVSVLEAINVDVVSVYEVFRSNAVAVQLHRGRQQWGS